MKKQVGFKVGPSTKEQLKGMPVSMSASISQAVANAYLDDGLIIKALKRRFALPPINDTMSERMSVTLDPRIIRLSEDLSARSQLSVEAVLRLAIEAHIFRL